MLLHKIRVHIAIELGKLRAIRIAVAGGMTEYRGVFVHLISAGDLVFAMGVIAAPRGIFAIFIQFQVIAVVLRLHDRIINFRAGNIQPRHGIGILLFRFRQLRLSVLRGNDLPHGDRGRLRLRRGGRRGIDGYRFLMTTARHGEDQNRHTEHGTEYPQGSFHNTVSLPRRNRGAVSFSAMKRNSAASRCKPIRCAAQDLLIRSSQRFCCSAVHQPIASRAYLSQCRFPKPNPFHHHNICRWLHPQTRRSAGCRSPS